MAMEGLRLISAAIAAQSAGVLMEIDKEWFLGNEVKVYDMAIKYLRRYERLPTPETVREVTQVRLPTVTEPSLKWYTDRMRDRYYHGQIQEKYAILREAMAAKDTDEARTIIEDMHGLYKDKELSNHSLKSAIGKVLSRSINKRYGMIKTIETGWESLDDAIEGWQEGDLNAFIARPGMGKTYILLQQALEAHRKKNKILFITAEMSEEQIARRYVAMDIGLDPQALRRGLLSSSVSDLIQELMEEVDKRMRIVYTRSMRELMARVLEDKPDLLMVDSVYKVSPIHENKFHSKGDKVGQVLHEIKECAMDGKFPVLLSSQFNREAGARGKAGSQETIGFSDAFAQDCATIISLKDGGSEYSRKLIIEKIRDGGGTGNEINIHFKFKPLNFCEMTVQEMEDDAVNQQE